MKKELSTMRAVTFAIFIGLTTLGLGSCKNYKAQYDELLEESAAMKKQLVDFEEEGKLVRGEYSEALETLNAIEDTLRAITGREAEIQKLAQSTELAGTISQRQSIVNKLQALKNANEQSKNQAKQLQANLNSFRVENEQLRKMISQAETRVLQKEQELNEAQGIIDDLRSALAKMESQLMESEGNLAQAYDDLRAKNATLETTNNRLQKTINELQQKTIFIEEQAKGYVACGTKKVLRRKGILSRMSMKLTKSYQSAVRANSSSINYYESSEVACGAEGKIIAVLPERAANSYTIEGNKLNITDTEAFWKTDKIVVIVKK